MKFKDLTECPFCGHDEFYTTEYVYGTVRCRGRFDGKEAENGEMYDGLNCKRYSGRCYCDSCGRYLGNRETGAVAVAVKKMLKRREVS